MDESGYTREEKKVIQSKEIKENIVFRSSAYSYYIFRGAFMKLHLKKRDKSGR